MAEHRSEDRHPFPALLYLLFFSIAGSVALTFVALAVCFLIYGEVAITDLAGENADVSVLKIVQSFSSIGTFILPAIFFARIESQKPVTYLKLDKPFDIRLILLASVIVFAASPFIEWIIQLNQAMTFPDFLNGVETWMKEKELMLEKLTLKLLVMDSITDLAVNLLVIAVLPAIGEELLFRGCLQKSLFKWTGNIHFAIWLAAIIFSTIHLQFYGFLPRMLLGALFGYLFVWSGNLWVPVVAHFINNGIAVVGAYLMQRRGEAVEMVSKPEDTSVLNVTMSIVFTMALAVVFYRITKREASANEE